MTTISDCMEESMLYIIGKLQEPWTYYEDNGFDELEEEIETDDNDDDETYDRKGRKRRPTSRKNKVTNAKYINIYKA